MGLYWVLSWPSPSLSLFMFFLSSRFMCRFSSKQVVSLDQYISGWAHETRYSLLKQQYMFVFYCFISNGAYFGLNKIRNKYNLVIMGYLTWSMICFLSVLLWMWVNLCSFSPDKVSLFALSNICLTSLFHHNYFQLCQELWLMKTEHFLIFQPHNKSF